MKKFRNRKSVKKMMYTFAASAMLAVPSFLPSLAVSAAAAKKDEESSGPDIATPVKNAFNNYVLPQVKNIFNWIVLPAAAFACLMVLIFRVTKCYQDYHNKGEDVDIKKFVLPGIGLIVAATAPFWMWNILG